MGACGFERSLGRGFISRSGGKPNFEQVVRHIGTDPQRKILQHVVHFLRGAMLVSSVVVETGADSVHLVDFCTLAVHDLGAERHQFGIA